MARSCVLLLLFLLPFSTGEWSVLVKGLDFYKNLTVGAVGLKQYALHFSNAVDYMKREAIDQYLDNNEKAALDELSSGLSQVQEVLVKAARGVTAIKERSNALLLVLNLSGIKTEQEKVEMAMQLFSALSKDSKAEVKEFEDGLLQANRTLQNSQMMLHSIVQRLYQLKEDNKADTNSAQNFHYAAMALEAALGTVGTVVFGWPLAHVGILFAVHSLFAVKDNTDFLEQQGKINNRIDGYETISMKTDTVCEDIDNKIKQVQEVYSKFGTMATVAGEQLPNPQAQCELIQELAEALVKACDTFL